MMKGSVYCADPRLYVPLVFAPIRWAPFCVSFALHVPFRFALHVAIRFGFVLRKLDHIGAANPCAAWLWPWLLSLGWLADLRNLGDEFAQFEIGICAI